MTFRGGLGKMQCCELCTSDSDNNVCLGSNYHGKEALRVGEMLVARVGDL